MSAVLMTEAGLALELEQASGEFSADLSGLAALLDLLEWKGSLNELLSYLPLDSEELGVSDIRDILAKAGFTSQLRKGRLSQLPDCDLPTLGFFEDGRTLVLKSFGVDGVAAILGDQEITLRDLDVSLSWLELQPAPVKQAQRGIWFQELTEQFNGPLLAVFILSFVNALLGLAMPLFTMSVYDFLIPSGSISGLIAVGSGALIALAWMVMGNRLRARILSRTAANMNYQIGRSLFAKLTLSPSESLMQSNWYQNASRIRDIDRVREFVGGTMAASLFDLPFIVVALAAIGLLAGWLVLVPLLGILIFLLLGVYFNGRLAQAAKNAAKVGQHKQIRVRQALGGLALLRQSGAHSDWITQFSNDSVRAARSNFSYSMVSALQQVAGRGLSMLIALGTLMTGIYLVFVQQMTAGGLIAAMMLIWRVTGPLQLAFFSASRLKQLRQSIRQINAIMDTPYEQAPEKTFAKVDNVSPSVEVDRVVYRYAQDRDAALNGASFVVQPGQKIAVVGGNGSGKSTLLACMAGLLRPQAGVIRVGGHNIRQFRVVDYRNMVAYINHDLDFLEGSVYDNLRAAAPLADREQMRRALKQFSILQLLEENYQGLDTPLITNGDLRLDKRVARGVVLARMHLRDPSIIIIDDLLEGGDHPVVKAFREYVLNLPSDKTMIFATHDNDLMLKADVAVIMDKGAVAQIAELNKEETSNPGEQA
jgi:ABC-type bacteriocin/lantibiotic exporter with double-glycine peptidase domain